VSTRVAAGAVAPLYTGGGAVDLVAAGARLAGALKPGQARIAVRAALLAAGPGADGSAVGALLAGILDPAAQPRPASDLYLVDGVGH
jgi:L-asparaginase